MSSPSDIITYIGVPLAVLGVLPILYTFTLAIITQRRVRSTLLHHGHKPTNTQRPNNGFTIRSSPMTSLLEVDLPRYTIAPLDRENELYWKTTPESEEVEREHHTLLNRAQSTLSMIEEGRVVGYLRGGSWRAFHWRKLMVGRKLYRIQYEDELREPPAEIDFSELIHFLLDWGAVPDPKGWEKLRSGGLWTPTGTILLVKPDDEDGTRKRSVDWVLRTSVPDDSDGILSVVVRWTTDLDSVRETRGATSLPPGWTRISQPAPLYRSKQSDDEGHVESNDLPTRIEELKASINHASSNTSCRFRAEEGLVSHIYWEQDQKETGIVTFPFHVYERSRAAIWFTYAASALRVARNPSSGGLWGIELFSEISDFIDKDSIPCGVMVLLDLVPESEVPQWTSLDGDAMRAANNSPALVAHRRFEAQRHAQKLEATMPPEQALVHKQNREREFHRQQHEGMINNMRAARAREEQRVKDAIASPRMNTKKVAQACLTWLAGQKQIDKEWTINDIAEAVLYLLALDGSHQRSEKLSSATEEKQQKALSEAQKVIMVLEEWRSWAAAGGMKRQQVQLLTENRMEFCFAAALVAVIQAGSLSNTGKAGADMLECLRTWRKVRLG